MNAVVPVPTGSSLPAALAPDLARALELALEEKSAATRRAYGSDFQTFEALVPGPWRQRAAGLPRDRGGLSGARRRNR
jgi:hypothetical protein